MIKRKLGNSGLEVAPLALGGNVFGWTVDEQAGFQILDRFVAAGFNLIDTADVYAHWAPGNKGGESETLIGNWLRRTGNRDKVILATKVGMEMGPGRHGLAKAYILQAVEDSLRRLQTDRIDLYQSHIDDPEIPFEETLAAYDQLLRQGKIRAIGASNITAARLLQALQVSQRQNLPRYECLQTLYNLYDRSDYETELEPLCRAQGLGVIGYFSLARGFLSGKYRAEEDLAKSPRGQGIKKYLNERGFRILKTLEQVATHYHATPASVALAWLIARPGLTAPISSATSLDQLNDLIAAAHLELAQDAIERLNQASAYPVAAAA